MCRLSYVARFALIDAGSWTKRTTSLLTLTPFHRPRPHAFDSCTSSSPVHRCNMVSVLLLEKASGNASRVLWRYTTKKQTRRGSTSGLWVETGGSGCLLA